MRRIAVAIIVAMTLLIAGCSGNGPRQGGGNRADLLSGPPVIIAPPDANCTVERPRPAILTGTLAAFVVACYTDDGTSMQLTNTSPAVLRVTSTGGSLTRWEVHRPYDGSWGTEALNQAVPADYDYRLDAALLVPGASLVAEGATPVTTSFTILTFQSAVAYESKVLAKSAEGIAKSRLYPGVGLLQEIATCATAARKVVEAHVSQNKGNIINKLSDSILPCAKLVDDPPTSPVAPTDELVQLARVAKTSLLEDGLQLGARVAVAMSRLR
jgi:hypothetical protein